MMISTTQYETIDAKLQEIGIQLVNLSCKVSRQKLSASATIYSSVGTGTDECTKAYKVLYAYFSTTFPEVNVTLEVSSPGIDYEFRDTRDWAIFTGRGIRFMDKNDGTMYSAKLLGIKNGQVTLQLAGKEKVYELSNISKVRLDPFVGASK